MAWVIGFQAERNASCNSNATSQCRSKSRGRPIPPIRIIARLSQTTSIRHRGACGTRQHL